MRFSLLNTLLLLCLVGVVLLNAAPESSLVGSGSVVLITSGTCWTGFTEASELNGKTLIGTVAANGDVGTTGGSDSITTVLNHTHTVNVNDPGHTHNITDPGHVHAASMGTTDGSAGRFDSSSSAQANTINTNSATTGISVNSATTGITATTSNPAGGVASIDNRSAFMKVIFCRKN